MGSAYRFVSVDIRSNTVLEELPLLGTDFTLRLNGAGDLNAQMVLTDPSRPGAALKAASVPRRTALFVDRGGVIVWGGIIWKRKKEPGTSGTVTLLASEWWSWFAQRSLSWDLAFGPDDQASVVNTLLTAAQDPATGPALGPGVQIGVALDTPATGTNITSTTYKGSQMQTFAQIVEDLAKQSPGGFDFAVDVAYGAGLTFNRTFTLSTARGVRAADSGLMFELPGNVIDYEFDEDALSAGNNVYGVGAGTGDQTPILSARDDASVAGGDVLTDHVSQYKNIANTTQLQGLVNADLARYKDPVVTPVLWVRADQDPQLGDYRVGDEARVRITDPWFPPGPNGEAGLDAFFRIIEIQVTPQSDTTDERVKLTFGPTL